MGGSRKIDMIGKRFGRLVVLSESGRKRKEIQWECLCDCGNITYCSGWDLRNGKTVSCGCKRKEGLPQTSYKHKEFGQRLYYVYMNIKTRCYNPKYYLFNHYGGKGITVCNEWLGEDGFNNFYKWALDNGYSDELSIDRIDNSKGYSPDNCRWVSMQTQQNNRTNNRIITVDEESHTMAEWSRISGIHYNTIQRRLANGWPEEDAVTLEPCHASRRYRKIA